MPDAPHIDELLRDIDHYAGRIQSYVEHLTLDEFCGDDRTQDAVIRCLEVIGEASAPILKQSSGFEAEHPDILLRQAYRARNRTAHGYGSVNLVTIWQSAIVAVPQMRHAVRKVLDGA